MSAKSTRYGKFTKLMAYHILGYIYRNVLPTIMDGYSMADHLGKYGGAPGPGFNDAFFVFAVHLFDSGHEPGLYIWAFF
jgi:hypothetical protein